MNSNATGGKGNISQEVLFQNLFGRALEKFINEPVDLVGRPLWPNPGTHKVVRKWMDEFQPELVTFYVSSFWFLYESTPVRVERKFGTAGRFVSQQSQRVAATPWLAHNKAFQWGRKQTQRVVGGSAWFEPDEVIARSIEIIREVIQDEGAYLVVIGPAGGKNWATDEEHLERIVARRNTVDSALASFCKNHHIEYVSVADQEAMSQPGRVSLQGDELHLDKEGHRQVAERYFMVGLGWAQRAIAARKESEENAAT